MIISRIKGQLNAIWNTTLAPILYTVPSGKRAKIRFKSDGNNVMNVKSGSETISVAKLIINNKEYQIHTRSIGASTITTTYIGNEDFPYLSDKWSGEEKLPNNFILLSGESIKLYLYTTERTYDSYIKYEFLVYEEDNN